MNRRELLAAFLGLPLTTLGCSATPSHLPLQGEIIGASVGAAHRLREGFRPQPTSDAWQDVDVVIVGGGVAGLSAGRRLRQQGIDRFVVLELEPELGGTSRGGACELVEFPWGAHYLPVPLASNVALIDLLDEMQLLEGRAVTGEPIVAEHFLCRAPQERLFIDGHWHEGVVPEHGASATDLAQFAAFEKEVDRWVAWRDSQHRRAFTLPVGECSRDSEVLALDRLTMSEWLAEHGWSSPRLRWFVDYACRDDYGLTIDQTSAWAGLLYFAARVNQSGQDSQPFITWPEGNARLVKHLAQSIGERAETGWVVSEITPLADGAESSTTLSVIAFREHGATTEVRGWKARRVILATHPFLAPHLVTGYREHGPQGWRELQFGSWMVANLQLSARPVTPPDQFPLSWDNVFYDSPSLGYVAATHQRGLDYGPTVLTYYYPLCDDNPQRARERLLSLDWAECAEIALSDIERAHPAIRLLTTRLDVMRWGHAMVRPTPGRQSSTQRAALRTPWRGVHFAHSSLSGIPLFEEAFAHGNRAAEEVSQELRPRS